MSIDPYAGPVHDWVKNYYGEVLGGSADLKTNACCATGAPPARLRPLLRNISDEVTSRFYGCGFPIPTALAGATVVDLGCGTGRDVYLLSQLVGPDGFVHGVDMTENQLAVARGTVAEHTERFGYDRPNVAFHQGYIEDLSGLPVESGSVDVVVSNCVVNLSPRKDLVLAEIFRILKPGGELYFSDVFADRRLPDEVSSDPILHSECLGGALYDFDFLTLAKATGFLDPRTIESAPITIMNDEVQEKVGSARFTSQTLRLFKLADLEPRCEDYGQLATYVKPIVGAGSLYAFDDHHVFELGRPERVCSNTAMMLSETRLAPHFRIDGDTSTHFGVFAGCDTIAAAQYGTVAAKDGGSGGSCC